MDPSPSVAARLGRYELVRRLGEGGTGVVWEAVLHGPEGFRKPVALKLLREGRVDAARRRSLVHEARLGALLGHPNVVVTFDLGEADGHLYVAMELVRGASIGELVAFGALSGEAVLDVGVQACAGLARIHALVPPLSASSVPPASSMPGTGRETTWFDGPAPLPARSAVGVVHRDVKPANLLLDVSGLVKVADLGLARLASGTGPRGGTPGYLPPEQRWGREDARADQFALGVTLYELATGVLPFGDGADAGSAAAEIDRILAAASFDMALEPSVPGLAQVLRRCLCADPDGRFHSIDELGLALTALRPRQRPGVTLLERLARVRPELASVASSNASQVRLGQLPPERDPLLGREGLVREVVDHVTEGARLVTVTGPAGVGKSRVALAAAHRLDDLLPGGALLVRGDLGTVDALCGALATGLGAELAGLDPVAQVGRILRDRGVVAVVLDDIDGLAARSDEWIAVWLGLAPDARFVCTSRVLLRLAEEVTVSVGPLKTDDAVALFRRRAVRPPSDAELGDARVLVEALDGLPLAIELAAARTRTAPIAVLLRHQHDRLRLLSGGDRDRPDRQRSLRAALDGSWELLSEDGRRALAQLSVFEGGFTLESAEAVLDLGPDAPWAMDLVQELVESSLASADKSGRFSMLGVVRAHASERGADDVGPAEVRHGVLFASWGSDAGRGTERLRAASKELRNLEAACRRAIAREDRAVAVPTALAVAEVSRLQGMPRTSAELLGAVHDLGELGVHATVRILRLLHGVHRSLGAGDRADAMIVELEALLPTVTEPVDRALAIEHLARDDVDHHRTDSGLRRIDEACALWRSLGDRRHEATLIANRALLERRTGTGDPAGSYARALDLVRAVGDTRLEAQILTHYSTLLRGAGRLEESVVLLRRAFELHDAVGSRRAMGETLGNLAQTLAELGRNDEALACAEQALAVSREGGDRHLEAQSLHDVAQAVLAADPDRAKRCCREALPVLRAIDDAREVVAVLVTLAAAERRTDGPEVARRTLEEAERIAREGGIAEARHQALLALGDLLADGGDLEGARAAWSTAEAAAGPLVALAEVARARGAGVRE